jgi:hypothetical protein
MRVIDAPRQAKPIPAASARMVGRAEPPAALCFPATTINAVMAAVPAWRMTRSACGDSVIRWMASSGPTRNR